MARRILVIGGTGFFGVPTANRLKEDGYTVRIMTRDFQKAKKIFGSTFEIFQGNATDKSKLEEAMKDCYGVHITVSGEGDKASAENVSELAAKMKIKHLTYVSGSTVQEKNSWFPLIKDKLQAEKAIIKSGSKYTIFRPTWPMEAIPRFVQKGKVTIIGKQPAPIHWFAVNDFTNMISAAYKKREAANKIFYIHGPEAYTMNQALEIYCNTFHPQITEIKNMNLWLAKGLKLIIRNDMYKMIVDLMGYFDKAGESGNPEEANKILGAPKTTLAMWMKPKVEKRIGRAGK